MITPFVSLQLGVAVHEMGHAIGFWHEHERADRDDYVTVNMSYVIPSRRHNYEKLSSGLVNTKDVPYDVGSLMHYTATVSFRVGYAIFGFGFTKHIDQQIGDGKYGREYCRCLC